MALEAPVAPGQGLSYRGDLQSATVAGGGRALRDQGPATVKYARAGSEDMVAAMLVAGAFVDQCLMWMEDHDYKDYKWRGDSALMAAAKAGHETVCAILPCFGANKAHKCTYDEDCYDHGCGAARRSGQAEIAAFIEQYRGEAAVSIGHSRAEVVIQQRARRDGAARRADCVLRSRPLSSMHHCASRWRHLCQPRSTRARAGLSVRVSGSEACR